MPMSNNMLENEMIGAIKIKDGLFIGDEYASTVSHLLLIFFILSHTSNHYICAKLLLTLS